MRILFSHIKIHLLSYLLVIISILTGNFKELSIFFTIIIVHEIGHITAALFLNWHIDKVIILPFGGLTLFNENINRPLKEEFIVLLCGPIMQILFYYIFKNIINNELFMMYHYAILCFNMLPIYPLDGSKLINLILNKFFSFKRSYLLTLYISLFITCLLILFGTIYKFNLLFLIIILFLINKIIFEYKSLDYTFNRFLLERHQQHFNFRKIKIIKGIKINNMFRDFRHLFYIDNKYYMEKEILRKRFDFKRNV